MAANSVSKRKAVVVDGRTPNLQALLAGLEPGVLLIVLDPERDGLTQIVEALDGVTGLESLEIVSHGAEGLLRLGSLTLTRADLAARAADLAAIGAALEEGGDILLWGCDVGRGEKGLAFVDELAALTGRDVAASDDATGGSSAGGNWTLEVSTGAITATSAFSPEVLAGIEGTLSLAFTEVGHSFPTLPGFPGRTLVLDFDNDGDLDILEQNGGNGTNWKYWRSNGDGTFTEVALGSSPVSALSLGDWNSAYRVIDVDGDGDLDIIAFRSTGTQFWRNDGGSFSSHATNLPDFTFAGRTFVGDYDGDGKVDILEQHGGNNTAWRFWKGAGDGNFTNIALASSPFAAVTLPGSPQVGSTFVLDFDGDGDLDIWFGINSSSGTFLRNDGGTFSQPANNFPVLAFPGRAVWGDFDGDGDLDFLYQASNGGAFSYFRNDGGFTFTEIAQASSPFAGITFVDISATNWKVGDWDGDGDLDIWAPTTTGGEYYYNSNTPPRITGSTPADNATGVNPAANTVLTFNEAITLGAGQIRLHRASDGVVVQTVTANGVRVSGGGTNTITIDWPADMAGSTAYYITFDLNAFLDSAGVGVGVLDGVNRTAVTDPTFLNFTTAAVNTAPTLPTNTGATVLEGQSVTITSAMLTAADAEQGAAALTFTITTAPDNGTLYRDGVALGLNSTFTQADVNANLITYVHNGSETTSASFGFSISDGQGGSLTGRTFAFTVTPVNDAPVVVATGGTPEFTEDGSAVDLFSGVSVSTVEAGQAVDRIVFTVSGAADGADERLTLDGTSVQLVDGFTATTAGNGLTVTVSVSGGVVTVTLEKVGGISAAAAAGVIDGAAYSHVGQDPTGGNRTVTLTSVRDTGGTDNGGVNTTSPNVSATVTVTPVNDAPVVVATGGTPEFTEDGSAVDLFSGVSVSTVEAGQSVDRIVFTVSGVADGAQERLSLDGTTVQLVDGFTATTAGNGLTVTVSVSGGVVTVTLAKVGGISAAAAAGVIDGATYSHVGQDPTGGDRTVTLTSVRDTGGTDNGGVNTTSPNVSATVTVTPVNDAPVVSVTGGTVGYTEGGAAADLFSGVSISTVEAGQSIDELVFTVSGVVDGALERLSIDGTVVDLVDGFTSTTATNSMSVSVSVSGGVVTVTLSKVGGVSAAAAATIIDSAAYDHAGDAPTEGDRTITLTSVRDTGGTANGGVNTTSPNVSTTVTVDAVNDAPATEDGYALIDEDGEHVFSLAEFAFSDVEGHGLAEVIFTTLPDFGQIVLTVGGVETVLSAGDSVTAAQIAAGQVSYRPPADLNGMNVGTFTFQVRDDGGTANGGNDTSSPRTFYLDVNAVNDAPVITGDAGAAVVAGASIAVGTGLTFSDVDAGGAHVTVTFSVSGGTLNATSGGWVTVQALSAGSVRLTGTVEAITAFVQGGGVQFTAPAGVFVDRTLTVEIDDGGNSGDGGPLTATSVGTIEVLDVQHGGPGNDRLIGSAKASTLYGFGGDDTLFGNDGDDFLYGGDGDDTLVGGAGADYLDGGDGFDTVRFSNFGAVGINLLTGVHTGDAQGDVYVSIERFILTTNADHFVGDHDANRVLAGAGDDVLFGMGGNDILYGQAGNDVIHGGDGDDILNGGEGDDILNGDDGNDVLVGAEGNDILNGGAGDDNLNGGAGDDVLNGGDGNDVLVGGDGDDVLNGGAGDDVMRGGAGADHFIGGSGFDTVDYSQETSGVEVLRSQGVSYGAAAGDTYTSIERFVLTRFADVYSGTAAKDEVFGGGGDDQLWGRSGDDRLFGEAGDDQLFGGDGDDLLDGGAGNDLLVGGTGRDVLLGGAGRDILDGGAGDDLLTGGAGADTFRFLNDSRGGVDRITDFNIAEGDTIDMSRFDFNTNRAGRQTVSWVEAFTGRAGQGVLSYDADLNMTFARFDVDGDGVADLTIEINGQVGLGSHWLL